MQLRLILEDYMPNKSSAKISPLRADGWPSEEAPLGVASYPPSLWDQPLIKTAAVADEFSMAAEAGFQNRILDRIAGQLAGGKQPRLAFYIRGNNKNFFHWFVTTEVARSPIEIGCFIENPKYVGFLIGSMGPEHTGREIYLRAVTDLPAWNPTLAVLLPGGEPELAANRFEALAGQLDLAPADILMPDICWNDRLQDADISPYALLKQIPPSISGELPGPEFLRHLYDSLGYIAQNGIAGDIVALTKNDRLTFYLALILKHFGMEQRRFFAYGELEKLHIQKLALVLFDGDESLNVHLPKLGEAISAGGILAHNHYIFPSLEKGRLFAGRAAMTDILRQQRFFHLTGTGIFVKMA